MEIVAEVGSNFHTLEDCLTSISMAKNCGADVVKFQAYNEKALYGFKPERVNSIFAALNSDLARMKRFLESEPHALPLEWLPKLKEKADACGIEFMCSAFSPELIDAVNPFVNRHKVASAECTHLRMLEKLRDIGKPVLLSTGAHGYEDIEQALKVLDKTPVTLLYCEASYPAKRIIPAYIFEMRGRFNVPVGFSDHSSDLFCIPAIAISNGATVIEKHVNFVGADGPDAAHSITGDEFKEYVDVVTRGIRKGSFGPTVDEKTMVLRHNRRLILTKDVAAGETLQEGANFGIYRSLKDDTRAASPFMAPKFQGKIAKRDLKAGDGLWIEDVV